MHISFALVSVVSYTTDVDQDGVTLIACQMELTWSQENHQEGRLQGFQRFPK